MPNELPYLLIKTATRPVYGLHRVPLLPNWTVGRCHRLTAQRARLVKVIKIVQTPLTDSEGFIDKADRKANQQACAASLKSLKADLKSADKSIAELAKQDPELNRLFERVTSVVGISQTTAAEIIVTTNEFKAIRDPKKFACYAGVVPFDGAARAAKFRPAQRPPSGESPGE
ncbi:transposase [Spirosoma flavum]|uniref:Transposase n=1 Tax=Spirosoma flavum TaxID=2048557 RepID=A0ABW6ATG6_9BACT